jgi:hypothetical protein
LEGIVAPEATTWTGTRRWGGSEFAGSEDELPLCLEEILGAWARDPDEFEGRANRVEETLAAISAELAEEPKDGGDAGAIARWAEIERFWVAIRDSLMVAA